MAVEILFWGIGRERSERSVPQKRLQRTARPEFRWKGPLL